MFEIKALEKAVYKGKEKKVLLEIDSLTLEEKKIYTLQGHNGAGKTTFLHILALLSAPTSGKVFYNSKEIDFHSEKQLHLLRQKIVLVEQHPIMFTGTVDLNVCLGLAFRNVPLKEQARKLDKILDVLEIKHLRQYKANTLSGGETQRVALARALMLSPKWLILDEPTASVDKESKVLIENIIQELRGKTSIIMTTHSEEQNTMLSDYTIHLNKGKRIE